MKQTKLFKRISAVCLVVLLMAVSSLWSLAADLDPIAPDPIPEEPYAILQSTSASFSISGVTANVYASITTSGASKVSIKMELQKKSGSTYSTTKTWSTSVNASSTSLSGSKTINPLSTYRLKVTFTATKNSTTESKTVYRY